MNIVKALSGWKSWTGLIAWIVVALLQNRGIEVPPDVVTAVQAWFGIGMVHKLAKAGK